MLFSEVWESYTLTQKVSLFLCVVGTILFVMYLVLTFAGYYSFKRKSATDDIDMPNEDKESFKGFFMSLFNVRGTIIILAFGAGTCFGLDFVLPGYAAILIGLVVGLLADLIATLILRRPAVTVGDVAVVSVKIGSDGQVGKVILEADGTELDAVSENAKSIRKGKTVVVTNVKDGRALVKKVHKKSSDRIAQYFN